MNITKQTLQKLYLTRGPHFISTELLQWYIKEKLNLKLSIPTINKLFKDYGYTCEHRKTMNKSRKLTKMNHFGFSISSGTLRKEIQTTREYIPVFNLRELIVAADEVIERYTDISASPDEATKLQILSSLSTYATTKGRLTQKQVLLLNNILTHLAA